MDSTCGRSERPLLHSRASSLDTRWCSASCSNKNTTFQQLSLVTLATRGPNAGHAMDGCAKPAEASRVGYLPQGCTRQLPAEDA